MFTIQCHTCREPITADQCSAVSTHRTSDGLIAYVRCSTGHLSVLMLDRRTAVA